LHHLYTFILFLALPFLLLRLLWRSIQAPAYFKRWSERFGFTPELRNNKPVIWIHAVSFGEVEASRPLVKQIQAAHPEHQILITTMTPTGSQRVKSLYTDNVAHCYLPYDYPFAVKRFLKNINPVLGIIMETEIWPNLVSACQQQSVPIVLANGRMSARSQKGYARFQSFIESTLNKFTLIAVQTQQDKQRFLQLGANPKQLHAIGNLKYEINLPASTREQAEAMRSMWNPSRPVWIAASTHQGEDEIVINAAKQVRGEFPDLLLILVPRHPERFDRVTALCQRSGFNTLRRTEQKPCSSKIQILVVDTMGELPLFYAAADVALVCGSLIPHGGHNILEPAALGRAIITGPHYFNFNEITEQFLSADAAVKVNDTVELAEAVTALLKSPQKRYEMGEAGLKLISHSQGASMRLMNLIHRHILR
jgi:3-deoxy-D-manno-octulosonic-acid transferase